jgi:hypothetical protein
LRPAGWLWSNAPVGDFAIDTAVEGGDGHYVAHLSRDWEIWGPNGGCVAAPLHALGGHRVGRYEAGDVPLSLAALPGDPFHARREGGGRFPALLEALEGELARFALELARVACVAQQQREPADGEAERRARNDGAGLTLTDEGD